MAGFEDGAARGLGRVALGMSGGVDSAVAAAVLLRAGYEVVGVTCLFCDDEASHAAARDAMAVCEQLGICHVEADCAVLFEQQVMAPFARSYACGLTPSPCVGCNAACKLPALMEVAEQMGCDRVATGHYARIAQLSANGRFVVKTGLDARKDQSYMLALLSQEQLARLVLPLGGLTKAEARVMAHELGLAVADKPESQDICFIDGDYRDFLAARGVADEPGDIVDADGRVLGRHVGLSGFTVGQRKGIGVAGPEPYYVVEKRVGTRELVVGTAAQARIGAVRVAAVNWQAFAQLDGPLEAAVKLRYRSEPVACIITPKRPFSPQADGGGAQDVEVALVGVQPATAPGQYAVFYQGATVLGGGMIEEVMRA
ncbi:MAG TPA: tRNA 2-thiouridine(34) synthase MnmA [Candidatus Aphodovivens avistercoris]|nr:tRNA 2-thiouridine(34) synthase MnmA [Candidatus Aphodovivens avistercoris]